LLDRCFRILQLPNGAVNSNLTHAEIFGKIFKIRTVFKTMLDVIVANSVITTPDAERLGTRKYLRVVNQVTLNAAHPNYPHGVLADATMGGWWQQDSRKARMRYGSAYIENQNALSTLIHEMAHFVSSAKTFLIGDYGYYHNALLSTYPQFRSMADQQLPTDL
jgi:hypothetical protein